MKSLFSRLTGGSSNFEIKVNTGDRKNAGTDANVRIRLYDDQEKSSEEITLNNVFKDDFERGHVDTFKVAKSKVKDLSDDAKITRIELWRDDSGLFSDWMVDSISVENFKTKTTYLFPVFRWIQKDFHYQIKHLDTSLPQFEEFPEQRKYELEEARKLYEYEQKCDGFPVQTKTVPEDENFSFSYKWNFQTMFLKLKAKTTIANLLSSGEFENLEAISKVYDNDFPPPKDLNGWKDDVYFGYQRIAGILSTSIHLATTIPDKLPVTDDMVVDLLEGLTIQDAIEQKRLFLVDYEMMDGIPTKEDYIVCSPIGLFFVNKDKDLLPIAIQLKQTPGPENPIFTPKDSPLLWSFVKMWFNNSDASFHTAVAHVCHTHFSMEGIAIASHRNLSRSHPIFKILAPHFLYVIAINSQALAAMVSEGSWTDTNLNVGSVGASELTRRGAANWRFDGPGGSLPEDLKNRGLDDPSVLPNYHFREDAMEVYEAILKYVTKYVNHYYSSIDLLKKDEEIQAWIHELVAEKPKGVGLKGLPGDGELSTPEQLSKVLTMIIYICSVSHAALNFPQYEYLSSQLNYAYNLKGAPPTSKDTVVTEEDILKALPDRPNMLRTLLTSTILSNKGTQSLGDFEVNYIFDPAVTPILEEFRKDLKDISANVKARNKTRKFTYDYLDPVAIPNSIST